MTGNHVRCSAMRRVTRNESTNTASASPLRIRAIDRNVTSALIVVDSVMPERGAWAHSGHILGTFWAQTISQFCKLLNMKEFSFGAGRGANPHDRKGRRILSLFFAILHRVAFTRNLSHK